MATRVYNGAYAHHPHTDSRPARDPSPPTVPTLSIPSPASMAHHRPYTAHAGMHVYTNSMAGDASSSPRSPTSAYAQHVSALSVEPMRTVPFAASASGSGAGASTVMASTGSTSGADWSRTHGHSRSNSLAASRRASVEVSEEKGGGGNNMLPRSPTSPYGHARIPSPLAQSPHFPPAWTEPAAGVEAQLPPRVRPPVADLLGRAVRDRFACNSKSGALGRGLIIGWIVTTLGFVAAAAFWKGELFSALDNLSKELYDMGYQGLVVYAVLIFITTIPPLPLYSTLIVLSGYTFGVWHGFVASYIASLVGAVVVFVVSRTLLRDAVTRSLASSPTATSLLKIIPQNPHLLLLIRVAPYPYNLLNVVLASAPSLSLKTYTACTAISLCKLVLHTWIGAGIHDLSAAYTGSEDDSKTPAQPPSEEDLHHERVKAGMTYGGLIMCLVLFVYLTHLAKKAIAKAQDEQHIVREEEVAFLTPMGDARELDDSF